MSDENEVVEDEGASDEASLRGDLEAAFNDDGETSESTNEVAASAEGSETQEEGSKVSQDPVGAEGAGEKPAPSEAGAPVDWNPQLREEWGQLSQSVKDQVLRREQQIAQAMQGTSQARKIQQDMGHITQQFGSVMTADGFQNPLQAVQSYLGVATTLRMGTATEKAAKVAELISHYGVDIQTLDSTLAGETPQDPAMSQMEQMLDQRLGPVNSMMQNLANQQLQRQNQTQQQASQEVGQFGQQAEFLNDVRHQMADMLDLATQQGRQMDLSEAYNIACQMNPQIKAVMDQRAQQSALLPKKRAASSVVGSGQGAQKVAGADLSSALNAAWDAQLG